MAHYSLVAMRLDVQRRLRPSWQPPVNCIRTWARNSTAAPAPRACWDALLGCWVPGMLGTPSTGLNGEGRAILLVQRALPPAGLGEGTHSCHRKWVKPSSLRLRRCFVL